ncbi:uncharacterized protein LOC131687215 [Topomyia yanbarensis]|uniref:uncharacterized protein LOC131687215 n=1 Tax=Topomyia yanbarensis TaxID=2498891 RepID=UPI00273C1594|nr:uncharacterized protein LOC131687215 [Topomyia yanbarensis]
MAAKQTEDERGMQEPPFLDAESNEQKADNEESDEKKTVFKSQSLALHPYDIGRLIPEYSEGDGVCKWLRRIDHFRAIYGWSEQMCLLYASTRLAGAAANWYRRQEEWIFNWRQFKNQIVVAFPETYDEADVHRELEAVKIEKGESYESYVYRVDAIAQKGDFSMSATLKYIIKGLRHDKVYGSLLSKQCTDTLELLRHIKWVASNIEMIPPVVSKQTKNTLSPGTDVICYNCREQGHRSLNCPKPQRRERCNKCLRVGHTSAMCDVRYGASRPTQQTTFNRPDGVKRTTTNAVFEGLDPDNQITVNQASQQQIEVEAAGERIRAMALFDTGSYTNLIKIKLLPNDLLLNVAREDVVGINGTKVRILGQFETALFVMGKIYRVHFLVVSDDTMQIDIILGRSFLIDNCIQRLYLTPAGTSETKNDEWFMLGDIDEQCMLDDSSVLGVDLNVGDDAETLSYRTQLENLVQQSYLKRPRPYRPLVRFDAEIRLKENKVFSSSPQRLSVFERTELDKIVSDLLQQGIIRESDSPYTSRVVLTRKRNNTFRMCVNYKPLNKIVERNHFPMPVIEDQVAKLQGKRYFTSLNLKNGFYHVGLTEESKKYTSFVTDSGQYEFNRLPFGYANSPAIFVNFITKVLERFIKDGRVIVFIDDMLIASETISEHFETLKEVLETLADNHLDLQFAKCQLLKTQIEYLGKFIQGFNVQAAQLYELLKEDREFEMSTNHIQAVESLKNALISKPVLRIYSPNAETELHTDASSLGFGGVLLQRQSDDGLMHPVMYHSRKTTVAESKLHSFELETLAIVYCLQRFRTYLFGLEFSVVTDCNSLKQTLEKKDINPKISRWALYLEQYNFTIVHRPGARMQHADALSRSHVHVLMEEECSSNIFEDALYVAQLHDSEVTKIKDSLYDQPLKDYEIRNAILYKVSGNKSLVYVPEKMIPSVINKFHNQMGHFGVDKVCELIKRTYWFPKMRERVQQHAKSCVTCIAYNPRNKRFDGNLHDVEKPKVPFEDQNNISNRDLSSLREEASQSMQKEHQYNKRVYDSHCKRNTQYQQGDLVMLRRTNVVGERSKLKPKFRGPYVVKKVLDNNRYVVADLDNYQVSSIRFEGIFDPLNMRLYQKAENHSENMESDTEYEDIEYLEDEEDD